MVNLDGSENMKTNAKTKQIKASVTETVTMYAVRTRGRNVPYTRLTYFVDEAETWMSPYAEIVVVKIQPYNGEQDNG